MIFVVQHFESCGCSLPHILVFIAQGLLEWWYCPGITEITEEISCIFSYPGIIVLQGEHKLGIGLLPDYPYQSRSRSRPYIFVKIVSHRAPDGLQGETVLEQAEHLYGPLTVVPVLVLKRLE
jgi:hypothetical protein